MKKQHPRDVKPEVQYRKRIFKNTLNSELIEHYSGGETREIEGKLFWVTYNLRGGIALLAKDSWIPQSPKW